MTQANEISQQLVDKNNKMMSDTQQLLSEQRKEIAEIGQALKDLGIDISSDLPVDSLNDDQKRELESFKAEIERLNSDLSTSQHSESPSAGRRVKVMI